MTAVLLTLFISALLCGLYLRLALRLQLMDTPNDRSSHASPTPHGGGTPALLSLALGVLIAAELYGPFDAPYITLLFGALGLCMLGVADDLRELPASLRFAAYALACGWLLLLYLPPVFSGLLQGLFALALLVAWLWLVNLYNFMDGIDGIAAIQCFLACASAAVLAWWRGGDSPYILFCLLLAVSHLGFLVWNWPPARMFMGDAGSIPTGFLLGGLALLGQASGSLPGACWLILLAAFITDATWTLLRRMARGERFLQAHRSHAYQRLARHWGGHLPVDFLLIALNGLWLFPLAALTAAKPELQVFLVILAYLPLLAGMAILRKLA